MAIFNFLCFWIRGPSHRVQGKGKKPGHVDFSAVVRGSKIPARVTRLTQHSVFGENVARCFIQRFHGFLENTGTSQRWDEMKRNETKTHLHSASSTMRGALD